jgi:hypothetical protein
VSVFAPPTATIFEPYSSVVKWPIFSPPAIAGAPSSPIVTSVSILTLTPL